MSANGTTSAAFLTEVSKLIPDLTSRANGHEEIRVRCPGPGHQQQDRHPSLRINVKKHVFYCDVCRLGGGLKKLRDLVKRRGIPPLGSPNGGGKIGQPLGCTLKQYAKAKHLRRTFLRQLGLRDGSYESRPAVEIPFYDVDGRETAVQFRCALTKSAEGPDPRFRTKKGDELAFYGLHRWRKIETAGWVLTVEGASDCHAAWYRGIPALGIPGKGTWRKCWAQCPDEIRELLTKIPVYLWQEPDATALPGIVGQSLPNLKVIVAPKGFKDLSDVHVRYRAKTPAIIRALKRKALTVEQWQKAQATSGLEAVGKVFVGLASRPSMAELQERIARLRDLASGLDPVATELLRPMLIQALDKLKVENAKRLVNAALKATPPEKASLNEPQLQGQVITLRTIEPAPDPVNGAQLLTDLATTYEKYLILPKHASTALALGVVLSYVHDIQEISPYIAVVSPTKRCGKTTLMIGITPLLVQRPLMSVSISPAALYRSIEAHHPTLLVDEADKVFKENDELLAIYNAANTRDLAQIVRTVGDDHEPRLFSTWCPKWLALIGKLPDTIADRSIIIPMRRRTPGETVARARRAHLKQTLPPLAQQVARWAKDHLDQLKDADPQLPEALNDRAQDNWRPLVAIAEAAGGDWPGKARAAALALSRQADDDDEGSGVTLLTDLEKLFRPDATGKPIKALATSLLIKRLTSDDNDMSDGLWQDYRAGQPITPHQLAKLLKPFGVRAVKIRFPTGPLMGYRYADLKDAIERYVLPGKCSSVPDFQGGYRAKKEKRGQRRKRRHIYRSRKAERRARAMRAQRENGVSR